MTLRERTILFIDDTAIQSRRGLQRIPSAATKHPDNPIIDRTFPWEMGAVYIFGSVIREPAEQLFRMWYQSIDGETGKSPGHMSICYAESDDGVRWRKPLLPIVSYGARQTTNIVLNHSVYPGNPYCSSVIRDEDAPPAERYKLAAWYEQWSDGLSNFNGAASFHSADGLRWKVYEDAQPFIPEIRRKPIPPNYYTADGVRWLPCPEGPPANARYVGGPNDASCISPDRLDGEYVHFQIMQRDVAAGKQVYERDLVTGRERFLAMHTSPDFVHWSDPWTIIEPAVDDPDHIQFYGMGGFRYGNYWLGTLWMYYVHDQSMDLELAMSVDGRNWTRPFPGQRLLRLGIDGEFDCGMILSATSPVIAGDEIYIYYSGMDHRHDERGAAAIGLATLKLDRWAGLQTGRQGYLETKPFRFDGSGLTVNAYAHGGEIRAQIADEAGRVLPGYEASEAAPVVGDRTAHRLAWNRGADLSALSGSQISLQFQVWNATIYGISQV